MHEKQLVEKVCFLVNGCSCYVIVLQICRDPRFVRGEIVIGSPKIFR